MPQTSLQADSSHDTRGHNRRRKGVLWVRRGTLFNTALLGLLWVIEFQIAERHWLSAVITYVPQHGLLLPVLGVLTLALRHKQKRWAWANIVLLLGVAHFFLGFQLPIRSTLASLQRRAGNTTRAQKPGGAIAPAPVRLRVMSYNIMGGRRGMRAVLQTIFKYQPDVLCLQEAEAWKSFDPMPALQEALPGYHGVRTAEVATFSRYPIESHHIHPFPAWAQRDILETVLNVDGRRVRALNVHFHAINFTGGPLYGQQDFPTRVFNSIGHRNEQWVTLLAAIDRDSTQSTLSAAPIVVVGDFNTPPRGHVYAGLASRFHDSWQGAGWGTGDSFRSDWPVVRIDYVWHSRHFQARRAFTAPSQASDHRPLITDLVLKG
ncbi:MAG: vancomycin resistance protein VanJ [Abditibacteriota bacterium]|nr:vancomycin resistance protein VanJ [Abditibacteriota bacterium]